MRPFLRVCLIPAKPPHRSPASEEGARWKGAQELSGATPPSSLGLGNSASDRLRNVAALRDVFFVGVLDVLPSPQTRAVQRRLVDAQGRQPVAKCRIRRLCPAARFPTENVRVDVANELIKCLCKTLTPPGIGPDIPTSPVGDERGIAHGDLLRGLA